MIKVVYFNQWFSSITEVIEDLRKKHKNNIKVIASSKNPNHAYKSVVDEFIIEDWQHGKTEEETIANYVEWSLNICKEYKVDIFFVKKYALHIAKNIMEFGLRSTFLVTENVDVLQLLSSKSEVYDRLKDEDEICWMIPEYNKGLKKRDIKELISLHSNIESTPWCFKLDSDEGGASFRQLEQETLNIESLSKFRINSVSKYEAQKMVERVTTEELDKLIFMEMLDSPEISVDCYNSKNGFIAICREKLSGTRVQRIFYNVEVSNICNNIGNTLNLRFPFNVQFRIKHNENKDDISNWRLLEINPRMSGGVYYSTLFGKNIADACLCDMVNSTELYNINDYIEFEDMKVTHVEKAIKLD